MATSPQRPPTAASLAADCAALISELESVKVRLLAMDADRGVFQDPTAAQQAGAPAEAQPAAPDEAGEGPSTDFVLELVTRFDYVKARLQETERTVRDLKDNGFVVSGFPSGRTKIPPP